MTLFDDAAEYVDRAATYGGPRYLGIVALNIGLGAFVTLVFPTAVVLVLMVLLAALYVVLLLRANSLFWRDAAKSLPSLRSQSAPPQVGDVLCAHRWDMQSGKCMKCRGHACLCCAPKPEGR